MSNDLPNPDEPAWLPAVAIAFALVFGAWAIAPWLSELVGGLDIACWDVRPRPGPDWIAGRACPPALGLPDAATP